MAEQMTGMFLNKEEERELVENIGTLQNDIDRLKHDYETRTCENCKYRKGEYCDNDVLWAMYGDYPTAHKDFGCNKFERIHDV